MLKRYLVSLLFGKKHKSAKKVEYYTSYFEFDIENFWSQRGVENRSQFFNGIELKMEVN